MKRLLTILAVSVFIVACTNKSNKTGEPGEPVSLNKDSMNNEILGLRTCAYMVADLTKAKEWYAKAFGGQPYFDEPFYVGFNIGGYELGLMPEENPPAEKAASVLTYWGVNDIDKVYQRLLSLGAEMHQEPENVGGDVMVASVRDPWGNIIGIIYNPEFRPE